MQKKKNLPQAEEKSTSEWQKSLKNEAKKEQMKKASIWVAIIAAAFIGLGGLVVLAGNTGGTTDQAPIVKENLPKVTEDEIIVGNKDAKVTIIEYTDYQCPACASYNPVVNRLLSEYDGKIRVVFRHFPLRNAHKNAQISGQAAQAAFNQGKFSEMKNMLFDKQADWSNLPDPKPTFIAYAGQLDLDEDKFAKDLESEDTQTKVNNGEKEAVSLGLQSTPTFFLGNAMISAGNYEDFKKLIDEELAKK